MHLEFWSAIAIGLGQLLLFAAGMSVGSRSKSRKPISGKVTAALAVGYLLAVGIGIFLLLINYHLIVFNVGLKLPT